MEEKGEAAKDAKDTKTDDETARVGLSDRRQTTKRATDGTRIKHGYGARLNPPGESELVPRMPRQFRYGAIPRIKDGNPRRRVSVGLPRHPWAFPPRSALEIISGLRNAVRVRTSWQLVVTGTQK